MEQSSAPGGGNQFRAGRRRGIAILGDLRGRQRARRPRLDGRRAAQEIGDRDGLELRLAGLAWDKCSPLAFPNQRATAG